MGQLAVLFAASLAAATLTPLPSEATLFACLQLYPENAALVVGIGDALCVAAGWLRVNWIAAPGFMAAGRLARYVAVAALSSALRATD